MLTGRTNGPWAKGGTTPTENLEDWSQRYRPNTRALTKQGSMQSSQHDFTTENANDFPWQLWLARLSNGEAEQPVSLTALVRGLLPDFTSSSVRRALSLSKWELEVDSSAVFGCLFCHYPANSFLLMPACEGSHISNTTGAFSIIWWVSNRISAFRSPRFLVQRAASACSTDFEWDKLASPSGGFGRSLTVVHPVHILLTKSQATNNIFVLNSLLKTTGADF